MRHRLLQLLLGVLVLGASMAVIVSSRPLAEALRGPLAAAASRAAAAPVRIGELQLSLLPPQVVLQDLELGAAEGPKGEPPPLHATASRVALRPHVLSLWHRRVVLGALEVDDLTLEARVPAVATPGAGVPEAVRDPGEALRRRLKLPLDVHRAELRRARVTLHLAAGRLTLDGLALAARRPWVGRRAATLQAPSVRFVPAADGPFGEKGFEGNAAAELAMGGPWSAPRQVALTNAYLAAPQLATALAANVVLPLAAALPEARLAGTLRLDADARALGDALAPSVQADGHVSLIATLGGTWADPEAALQLAGRGLRRRPHALRAEAQASAGAQAQAPRPATPPRAAPFAPEARPKGTGPRRGSPNEPPGAPDSAVAVATDGAGASGAVVAGAARLTRGGLELTQFALAPGAGGAGEGGLTGAGTLTFAAGLPVQLKTYWHGARVATVARLLATPPPALELGLRGEIALHGHLGTRRATATLQLGIEDFRLGPAPATAVGAPGDRASLPASAATDLAEATRTGTTHPNALSPATASPALPSPPSAPGAILAIDALGLSGNVQLFGHGVHLEGVQVHRRGATVSLEGPLNAGADGGPATLGLQVWAGGLPLQSLGPIAGLAYAGVASFGGSVRGPWSRPVVEAALKVDGLRIGPIGFGEAEGVLHFAAPTLQLLRFDARRGGGRMRGEGAIGFGGRRNTVSAEAQLTDWDAADVLGDFGAPQRVGDGLEARLWGDVALHGALDRPSGDFHLRLPQLGIGALRLGAAELHGTLSTSEAWVEAELVARPPVGTLAVQLGIYDPPAPPAGTRGAPSSRRGGQRLRVSAAVDKLALAPLLAPSTVESAAPVQGELTLRLDAEGTLAALPSSLVGTAVAEVQQLQLGNAALGGAHALLRADAGRARLELRLLRGGAHLAADLGLAAPWPLRAEAQLDHLDLAALRPLLGGGEAWQEVRAAVDGEAAVQGALAHAEELAGHLTLKAAEVGYRATRLQLRTPITLRLARGRLQVPAANFADRDASVTVRGAVPLMAPGELDLHCEATGDLRGLRGLLPGVLDAHGPLRLNLHVRGPLARPQLLGELAVRGAQLRLADGRGQLLEELEMRVLFSGRAVAITAARARLGRGRLRLSGEVSLASDRAASGAQGGDGGALGLRLQLDQVPLALSPDLGATVTGGLELGGRLDAPSLRGELRVSGLRYTARLDLDRLVPRRAAPPLRAPFSPLGRPLHLAIKLRAPADLIVSSQVLEAEFAADLLVTGTTERVGLLGSLTPLWARARYNNNLFTLTHATVDFTDEFRISPSYSVQAHTRACQMEVDVMVQGDVDGFTVQPTGRDEHGSVDAQDLMTCLNFGLRLSDFAPGRGGASAGGKTAGVAEAFTGSLDALWSVSGLDDKVRNLLPIRVDELRLTSGWSSLSQRTTARVLVGKELGHKVGLRYSRSLDEYNDQAFSLDYRLQPRATLQANWLSALNVPVGDFGVDFRLHWELR